MYILYLAEYSNYLESRISEYLYDIFVEKRSKENNGKSLQAYNLLCLHTARNAIACYNEQQSAKLSHDAEPEDVFFMCRFMNSL